MKSTEALHTHATVHSCCGDHHCTPTQPGNAPPAAQATQGTVFRIAAMDCAAEESEIRRALASIPGIRGLGFQLGARTLTIDAAADAIPAAVAAIRKAGFDPQPIGTDDAGAQAHGATEGLWRMVLALGLAIAAEALSFFSPDTTVFKGLGMALAAGAIGLAGFSTYRKGLAALMQARLNINALMTVAVTGAFLIGQWPEAAMVMALYAIAEAIEARAVDRARNAIKSLLALAPEQAEVRQGDGSWTRVGVKAVVVDATVRIRPGERVPLDGVVTLGQSAIDQSPVTGESLPIDKAPGDEVYAGTINQSAALEFRVTAPASDSTLARIIHAVEQAQGTRAPTQRFVDQFSRIYTPTVFALAVAVALLPPLLLGGAWLEWAYRALVLLVIACPCALVISTPVTIVSGLAAAARRGILIKGGVYLELGHQLRALALDKTGTLTHGRPVQTDYLALHSDACDPAQLAASLAQRSDHPVSQAIARHAEQQGVTLLPLVNFTALPGRGVSGLFDGQLYQLGNHRLVEELGLCSPALEALLEPLERQGKSVVLLCAPSQVLALFAVADTLKASSQAAIAELQQLGIKTCMLTGDNAHTAAAIALQAGIDEAHGNLLPEHKLAAIQTLQGNGQIVGMVGDGINDAPALAQANIGFAMGAAGSDSAIETADVALMDDDLRKIPAFIRLSRRTAAILKQNIALALGVKALFLLITLTGHASLWMAVFADMGVSLLVVANGLRLLRQEQQA